MPARLPHPGPLEWLAVGDLTPAEAVQAVREALEADQDEARERTYEAVRSVAWKKLTARLAPEELSSWHDVLRQTKALFEIRDALQLADRVGVLSDLMLESMRFASANSPNDMMGRPHVLTILRAINEVGESARRQEVQQATGLGQANLSRILAHMISAGLVNRRQAGKEVVLTLTSLARELLPTPDDGNKALRLEPALGASDSDVAA